MSSDDDDEYVVYGNAYSDVERPEQPEKTRTWVMQRGLWLPKDYAQAARPIGFVWD